MTTEYKLMPNTSWWHRQEFEPKGIEIGHTDRYCWTSLNLTVSCNLESHIWQHYEYYHTNGPCCSAELSFVHRSSQQRAARHLRGPVFETVVEKNYSMPYSNFMPIIRKLLKKLRTNSICLEQFAKFTIWFVHRIEHRNILDLKISNICTPLIIGDQLWQGHIAIIRTTGI